MQPINELLSAAGRCAGRGRALIKQLANNLGVGPAVVQGVTYDA